MKTKIDGYDLWKWEIAFYVKELKADLDVAEACTIIRWMKFNDLRPLRDALAKAPAIDDKMVALDAAVVGCLIELLDEGRLTVKLKNNRPKSPEKFARDMVAALHLEKAPADKRADVIKQIFRDFGLDKAALSKAVTRLHNYRAERSKPDAK
jgi:hypothetical protein